MSFEIIMCNVNVIILSFMILTFVLLCLQQMKIGKEQINWQWVKIGCIFTRKTKFSGKA